MPKVSLSGMTVEALMDLRQRVDQTLHQRRADMERQLKRMGSAIAVVGGGGGGSALKEKKCHRNIVVPLAKRGQVVAQHLVGLLLRSKVARNLTIS